MSGPLSRADAVLASRLAPWVELLAPKAPVGAGQAEAVSGATRVDNEVLLSRRADVRSGALADLRNAASAPAARSGGAAALSVTASVIHELLSDKGQGDARPVAGSAPLWAGAGKPAAANLAAALSQQVSESGLFYESHLAQFAAGARSLVQMQREPQAALAAPGAGTQRAGADVADAQAKQQQQRPGVMVSLAAPQAPAPAVPAIAMAQLVMPSGDPVRAAADAPVKEDISSAKHSVASQQSVQGDGQLKSVAASAQQVTHKVGDVAPVVDRAPVAAAPVDAQGASTLIHPQAAPLVHQQLDLLASSMFRWSGEAWPGVPMQWTVQEEEGGRREADADASQPAQWSTTVSLELPRLGRVDLRMSLSGNSARAQLVAPERHALMQLQAHRSLLSQRMAAAGFELRSLQLDSEMTTS